MVEAEAEAEVEVVSSPGTVVVEAAVLGVVVVRRWMPCERGMKILSVAAAARTGRRAAEGYPPPPVVPGLV